MTNQTPEEIARLHARMTEIETRLAFQEDALQQLNAVMIRQAAEIDRLLTAVAGIEQQLRTALPALVGNRSDEPPPPHY
jgi:SlyX protein